MWLSPQCEDFSENIVQILLVLIDSCEKCLPFTHGLSFTHDLKNHMICPLHLDKNTFYLWLIFYRVIFGFSSLIFVGGELAVVFILKPASILNSQENGFLDPLVKELVSNIASLRNSPFFSFSNPCLKLKNAILFVYLFIEYLCIFFEPTFLFLWIYP